MLLSYSWVEDSLDTGKLSKSLILTGELRGGLVGRKEFDIRL